VERREGVAGPPEGGGGKHIGFSFSPFGERHDI
jgi:hypothetical protein